MTNCPECDSGDIEMDSGDYKNGGQGYCWITTYDCYCNDCGCVFDKIESTEITYEIKKYGIEKK